jgi:hypothetical protein
MRFLPTLLQKTNRWRGTPHWAIIVGAGIPLAVVVLSRGSVGLLGDLYAFGLLGAFTVTCLSLDIVRWHERKEDAPPPDSGIRRAGPVMLAVGFVTTALVALAWTTNLVAKPLATVFGGGLTLVGLAIALINSRLQSRRDQPLVVPYVHRHQHPVLLLNVGRRIQRPAVVTVLPHDVDGVPAVVMSAAEAARGRPIVFIYDSQAAPRSLIPGLLEIVDPYLDDPDAQDVLSAAAAAARRARANGRYIYLPEAGDRSALDWLLRSLRSGTTPVAEEVAET